SARPTVAPSAVSIPLREASLGAVAAFISSSPGVRCIVHGRCRRDLFEQPPRRASAAATEASLRQSEHEQLIAKPRLELGRQADETEREPGAARAGGDVLLTAHGERVRVAVDARTEIDLPQ